MAELVLRLGYMGTSVGRSVRANLDLGITGWHCTLALSLEFLENPGMVLLFLLLNDGRQPSEVACQNNYYSFVLHPSSVLSILPQSIVRRSQQSLSTASKLAAPLTEPTDVATPHEVTSELDTLFARSL